MMTNNPNKTSTLEKHGIKINGVHPLIIEPDPNNKKLIHALLGKINAGHLIDSKDFKE